MSSSRKRKTVDGSTSVHATKRARADLQGKAITNTSAHDASIEDQDALAKEGSREQRNTGIEEKPSSRKRSEQKNSKRKSAAGENLEENSHSLAKRSEDSSWTLSALTGGRFLSQDPIFVENSEGEEFLIAAKDWEVQLLSLDASLVVRAHPATHGHPVVCYAVDPSSDSVVYITYQDGSVENWHWETGKAFNLQQLGVDGSITSICPLSIVEADPTIFSLTVTKRHTSVYAGRELLHKVRHNLRELRILGNAEYILAYGASIVLLGFRTGKGISSKDFTWIEIPLTDSVTTVDARVLSPAKAGKASSSAREGLSLAIGHENGQIHLYDDVSMLFASGKMQWPSPRILHWHRHAVSSVRFSRDGVYLISGGTETVLVLWQLNTGKKQFLPHLTSAIERLVVNPQGDRYALHMGDNSIMVISTSELKPVANFAGLQLFPLEDTKSLRDTTVLCPNHANQLLLAVPPTRPGSSNNIADRPFLQTFDIATDRHVTRQALTRNNVTDFNEGPGGTPIRSPDVAHLAISPDGQWLATVDEWAPPVSDLVHLAEDDTSRAEERDKRREVYLKIWHWDEEQAVWLLTTRADGPHGRSDKQVLGAGRVLAMVSSPVRNSFATIGEDMSVRIWRPKSRMRHGVALRDDQDRIMFEWVCKRTVMLPLDQERGDSPMGVAEAPLSGSASMAFSHDGSILAVSVAGSDTERQTVHFLDPSTGELMNSNAGLAEDGIVALGFLTRYLIVITLSATVVWDMITATVKHRIRHYPHNPHDAKPVGTPMLTINHDDGTFAVSIPAGKHDKARLVIYGSKTAKPLHAVSFDSALGAVLSRKGDRGYKLLFADATIRILSPTGQILGGTAAADAVNVAEAEDEPETIEDGSASVDVDMSDIARDNTRAVLDISEDDRPVVRPEQLADLFDVGQSFTLPPVRDMFQAVAKLFGREPLGVR